MKIRVTSVSSPDTTNLLLDHTNHLQDLLQPAFANKDYGASVDQFVIVFISLDPEFQGAMKFLRSHDKSGTLRNMIDGARVKFVSIAVPIDPLKLRGQPASIAISRLKLAALDVLKTPTYEMPKSFARGTLIADLSKVFEV